MAIKTAKVVATTQTAKSGRTTNDVIFKPGDTGDSKVIVVEDFPVHVFGGLGEGEYLNVTRVYDGPSRDCIEIPDLPVLCASGVIKGPDGVESPVYELWLTYRGSYKFSYMNAGGQIDVPADRFVWHMFDNAKEGCCNGC